MSKKEIFSLKFKTGNQKKIVKSLSCTILVRRWLSVANRGLGGRDKICLLDERDGLSTLEGQSIERLASHEHLLQTGDLNDHARDFGSQWRQILLCRLVRWNLLE